MKATIIVFIALDSPILLACFSTSFCRVLNVCPNQPVMVRRNIYSEGRSHDANLALGTLSVIYLYPRARFYGYPLQCVCGL